MRLLLRKTLPFLLARKNKSKLLFCHSLRRPVEPAVLILSQIKIKKRPKGLLYFYGGSERIRLLLRKILPFLLAQKEKSKLFVFHSLRRPVEPTVLILSQVKIK